MNRRSKTKSAFGYGIFPESESPYESDSQFNSQSDSQFDNPPDPALPKSSQKSSLSSESASELKQDRHTSFSRHGQEGRYEERLHPNRPKSYNTRHDSRTSNILSRICATGKRGEPLCLAELLAIERSRGLVEPENYDETYEKLRQSGDSTYLSDLQKMTICELVAEARKLKISGDPEKLNQQELIFHLLRNRVKENGLMFGEGTLEILPDQFGFLRSSDYHYISSPDDIYISPSQIRRFGLRKGCTVSGQIRPPKENERYFALLRVEAINHEEPNTLNSRPFFEDLTPVHPNCQIVLERPEGCIETKIVDRLIPIGFGQRGLIVSPPRSGKTVLLRNLAAAAMANYPDLYTFVLMIDERPEEVTEMARHLKNDRCEVICSLFDEPASRHIHVAEIVLEKAKRMVEYGKDVIIFLDSITQLVRAWNSEAEASLHKPFERNAEENVEGKAEINIEPIVPLNFQACKRFFSAARKVEDGGSLTILATALIDTQSALDEMIYENIKGTGNLEIHLNRQMADKRIWPAIDIHKSGTRHEEYLFSEKEISESAILRRHLADMNHEQAMEHLIERFRSK